jgi:hypothetical protein
MSPVNGNFYQNFKPLFYYTDAKLGLLEKRINPG